MSTTHPFLTGLESVRRNWGWYLLLGIVLIVLGSAALIFDFATTVVSVVFFGWLLVISGIVQVVQSFQVRAWGGFFLHLLQGILEVVVGFMLVSAPVQGALLVTLLAAAYLLVGGLFRIGAALAMGFQGSGWVAFSGLISFILGLMLWRQWPYSGFWFIGMCVGIDLIFNGWSWVAFALACRRHAPFAAPPAAPPV